MSAHLSACKAIMKTCAAPSGKSITLFSPAYKLCIWLWPGLHFEALCYSLAHNPNKMAVPGDEPRWIAAVHFKCTVNRLFTLLALRTQSIKEKGQRHFIFLSYCVFFRVLYCTVKRDNFSICLETKLLIRLNCKLHARNICRTGKCGSFTLTVECFLNSDTTLMPVC